MRFVNNTLFPVQWSKAIDERNLNKKLNRAIVKNCHSYSINEKEGAGEELTDIWKHNAQYVHVFGKNQGNQYVDYQWAVKMCKENVVNIGKWSELYPTVSKSEVTKSWVYCIYFLIKDFWLLVY